MVVSFFKKINTALQYRTTYQAGLLQAKVYRILKQHTNSILSSRYGISTTAWAFLGFLFDADEGGVRLSDCARELGVEGAFITTLAASLEKKGCIAYHPDPADRRVKRALLTPKGKHFVTEAEKVLRQHTKVLLKNITTRDLLGYLKVLQTIVENNAALKNNS